MYIYGDYNTAVARLMTVQLVKCHGQDYCASDEEIRLFFRNKFLVFLYNQIRFDSNYYGQEAIIPKAEIFWIPVNTQF